VENSAEVVLGEAARCAAPGDTRATLGITVLSVWGLRVVVTYLLGQVFGLALLGAWLGWHFAAIGPLNTGLATVGSVVFLLSGAGLVKCVSRK
jgi:Na+-driven multidrug efflux pump